MTNCLRTTDKKVNNPENQFWVNIEFQKFAEQLTRKSTIQRVSFGLTLSFKSLLAIRCGCMVMKAEEKLMKIIWTNEPVFLRCIVRKSECCIFGASVVLVCKLQLFDLPAALKFEIMCQSPFFFRT